MDRNHYTIGFICALPLEMHAATMMLDNRHSKLEINDGNAYRFGSIGKHNIVIACLPIGQTGTIPAAIVAEKTARAFPNLRFCLMVGIGGGVSREVRLGDVVVGIPKDGFPGVVQWDMGKMLSDHTFIRTGSLDNPPRVVLTAMSNLVAERMTPSADKLGQNIRNLTARGQEVSPDFLWSDTRQDILFKADYEHCEKPKSAKHSGLGCPGEWPNQYSYTIGDNACQFCDPNQAVWRAPRPPGKVELHCGLIASGNKLVKDSKVRDLLSRSFDNLLCVEMEAAGVAQAFPCLVIRGISDYCDSHKNDSWQKYAATVAAAFAKELLDYIDPAHVEKLGGIMDVLKNVGENVIEIRDEVQNMSSQRVEEKNEEQKKKLLDWLTSDEYRSKQIQVFEKASEYTGRWFLESPEFQYWLKTAGTALFCHGIPGAGKTVMTSIVVEHLRAWKRETPGICIAYIYFDCNSRDNQTLRQLMESLLHQILSQSTGLPTESDQFLDGHMRQDSRPSSGEIRNHIGLLIRKFSRTFVVVDALDECSDVLCRDSFLEILLSGFQNGLMVNILATSLWMPEIKSHFNGQPTIEIRALKDDVEQFVSEKIMASRFIKENEALRSEIAKEIVTAVDGVFLLAHLYIGLLVGQTTENEIRNTMKSFHTVSPGTQSNEIDDQSNEIDDQSIEIDDQSNEIDDPLDKVYEKCRKRIVAYSGPQNRLVMKVLRWVMCAKRTLTAQELIHALATRDRRPYIHPGDQTTTEVILSTCVGLVTIDTLGYVHLAHRSTQKYLERTRKRWWDQDADADAAITTTCITYLSFLAFKSGISQTEGDFSKRLSLYPFYDYAALNWGFHACTSASLEVVRNFLKEEEAKFEAASQPLIWQWEENYKWVLPLQAEKWTWRYSAVFFDLYLAITSIRDAALLPSTEPEENWTLFLMASFLGREATVELLLKTDASVNRRYDVAGTPLLLAVHNGHLAIVDLLLKKNGSHVDYQSDNTGWTPLRLAADKGHTAIVDLLLEKGAHVNRKFNGMFPLLHAAKNGHVAIVKLLLRKGALVNVGDDDGWTPLNWAATVGSLEVMRQLLSAPDVNVDHRDTDGRTALSVLVEECNIAKVKLLLEHHANPNICSYLPHELDADSDIMMYRDEEHTWGRSPLSYAAEFFDSGIVELLLDYGAEVDSTDEHGRTPLIWAAELGHSASVRLLLDNGAQVSSKDVEGVTALSFAAQHGNADVIEMLLEKGAEVNSRDNKGRTALSWAAKGEQQRSRSDTRKSFELLFNNGAKVDIWDYDGLTPLSYAVKSGDLEIAELLLRWGADPHRSDKFGKSPYRYAGEYRDEDFLELFRVRDACFAACFTQPMVLD